MTQITRLTELRGQLTGMLTAIPGSPCPDPAPGTWLPALASNLALAPTSPPTSTSDLDLAPKGGDP